MADIAAGELGGQERLFPIQPVIAGEQIAHGGSERKQRHTLRAKEFDAQEY